jgi:hypothetical protein
MGLRLLDLRINSRELCVSASVLSVRSSRFYS